MALSITSPVYWFYIPVTLAWICFIISVGDPNRFIDYNWLWFLFRHMSPYFWSALGVAFAVGMSILGAAWYDFHHHQQLFLTMFPFRYSYLQSTISQGYFHHW